MANEFPLSALMAFIKQPAASANTRSRQRMSLPPPSTGAADRRKREAQQSMMAQMAKLIPGIMGQKATETEVPFQQDMMEGETPIPGLSDIERTEGTKMYDETVPMDQRLMQRNQDMMASGNPMLAEAGIKGLLDMQKSRMDAMKPQKPAARSASHKYAVSQGNEEGTDDYRKAYKEHAMKAGTSITMNTGKDTKMGTPEENKKWGFPPEMPTYWNKSGALTPARKVSTEEARTLSNLDAMKVSEDSMSALFEASPNFDPGNVPDFVLKNVSEMGWMGEIMANEFMSPEAREYSVQKLNWIAANRSYLSGAAVPTLEVKRDEYTYFSRPNETPALKALKKDLRMARMKSIEKNAKLTPKERLSVSKKNANSDYRKILAFRDKKEAATDVVSEVKRKFDYSDPKVMAEYEAFKKSKGW